MDRAGVTDGRLDGPDERVGAELVPFGPGATLETDEVHLSETDEVLDGEVVREGRQDFEWVQWWDDDRMATNFKLRVWDTWYQRVRREDWEELNRLLEGMAALQRRTARPGDVGPKVRP